MPCYAKLCLGNIELEMRGKANRFGLFVPTFSFIYETFLFISYPIFNVSSPSYFVPEVISYQKGRENLNDGMS